MINNYILKHIIAPLLFILNLLVGQVSISPTNLFINDRSGFETVVISNGTNDAQEVSVSFLFAYSISDEFGNLTMEYNDETTEDKYSATDWVNSFPKTFILQPNQRQVVRLRVSRPRDVADGTYWTRIKTTSNAKSKPVGEQNADGISAQINFQFEQITGLFYKVGDVNTSLEISDTRILVDDQKINLIADVKKGGNSPYLGSMYAQIKDAAGNTVKDGRVFVSIYFDGTRKLDIDRMDLQPGKYSAEVSFQTDRADIQDEDIIKAETVTSNIDFEIN